MVVWRNLANGRRLCSRGRPAPPRGGRADV